MKLSTKIALPMILLPPVGGALLKAGVPFLLLAILVAAALFPAYLHAVREENPDE